MKNVQISFDENILKMVDRYASSARLSRSAVVREAVERWVREREIKDFEDQWIRKLKASPDDSKDTDSWIQVQEWSGE
jgi:metal-responsive CopG/Arc/MetJ family transcriptional regulator